MSKPPDDQPYRFPGFIVPAYTQVPDQLFDELLSRLTESELKVLLYIIRRTFGFKKSSDNISLKQLVEGIATRDGRQLDHGAGVSKTSAVRGVNGLIEKQIIVVVRNRSAERGDEPTTYKLHMHTPVSRFETRGVPNLDHGGVPNLDPQETVEQQTEQQERPFEYSKDRPTEFHFDEIGTRTVLVDYISDFAREFNDQVPLRSSVTRAVNLCRESGLSLDEFIERLYEARARTKEYTGSIKAQVAGNGPWNRKPQMAYFFSILTDLVGTKVVEE